MSGSTRDVITQLLRNIGGRKEVEQYLKQFASVESTKFAVIKVGGGIVRDQLQELCSSLTFLYQAALYPIVIHGGGPQLNAALQATGKQPRFVGGMRVTDHQTLRVASKVFTQVNHEIVDGLEDMGTRARPIPTGVFEAQQVADTRLACVGEVCDLDLEPIRYAIRTRHLPILSPLALSPTGQLLNVNADVAARVLAQRIEPFKIIFLTPTGGLLDGEGKLIPAVNLCEDFDNLMREPWLTGGMRLKVREIKALLDGLPMSSSVAMTTPAGLAKELFTHRGAGTLFRRGERVLCVEHGLQGLDLPRLRRLLESCFGRKLVSDYFERREFFRVYVTESYRATAIVTREGPHSYLDKFAVTQKAQGEGLGSALWTRLRRDNPQLVWRSRVDNRRINPWYFAQAEGSLRNEKWVVFWYGIDDFDAVQDAIGRVLQLPASLKSHGVGEASGREQQ